MVTEDIGGVHSSFGLEDCGLGEAISRESSEIQNEGDGIVVIKPGLRIRKILTQLVSMLPALIPAMYQPIDYVTVSIRNI